MSGLVYIRDVPIAERVRAARELVSQGESIAILDIALHPGDLSFLPAEVEKELPPVPEACFNGHLYTPENTYIHPTGEVRCRTCQRLRRRRRWRETGR